MPNIFIILLESAQVGGKPSFGWHQIRAEAMLASG